KKKGILGKHELCPLWTKAKQLILSSYPNDDQAQVAESMINEFDRIDKYGESLRYDREKDTFRVRRYESLPSHIDIAALRARMDLLYQYLDFSYGGIDSYWDAGQNARY